MVFRMNYTWLKTFVEDLTLQPNGRLRMDCPICAKKNTFSVTDDGFSRMYNCFYANCDARGSTKIRLTKTNSRIAFKQSKDKVTTFSDINFELPTTFVPLTRNDNAMKYVHNVNSYSAYTDGRATILYDIRQNRVVFVVKHNRKTVDAVGKSLSDKKPKWYRYGKSHYPFICGHTSKAFIVEDCASACSISDIATGIALLGTSMLPQHLDIIKKYDKIIVALDKDATSKACVIARQLSQHVDTQVAFLQDDLKNLKDDDRERLVRKYIN